MEMPITRKLVVLGTAHQLQGKHFRTSIDDKCYRDLIKDLILKYKFDFIFEEAAGFSPTHAELLAKAQSKPIEYIDVDPPKDERAQHGLSEDTGDTYMVDMWQLPPCQGQVEDVDRHAAREEFWLKRIMRATFTIALMICGNAHGLSFAFRLRDAGFDVENCFDYMPYDKLCSHARMAAS
jgi:hypothetical protein